MRNVILHYHLFKNAGTSIDQMLKASFGGSWIEYDGSNPNNKISSLGIGKVIIDNKSIKAVSSHQVVPPLPDIDANVHAIVMLRHPIDRILSSYKFEWQIQAGCEKPKGSLKDYIEKNFKDRNRNPIENFQLGILSNIHKSDFHGLEEENLDESLENAKRFIDSLNYFGIVEQFDESVKRLHFYLKSNFPEFKAELIHANRTENSRAFSERLNYIKDELGEEYYSYVVERCLPDLKLYQYALNKFNNILEV